MDKGFLLSAADRAWVNRMIAWFKGMSTTGGLITNPTYPPRMPPHRSAVVYGGSLTAATYSAGGELQTPGIGYVKLRQLFSDASGVRSPENTPVQVLSLIERDVEEGEEVILMWDTSVCKSDNNDNFASMYLAIKVNETPIERVFFICGSTELTITNTDGNQQIEISNYQNFDEDTYEPAAGYAVTLKRAGYYEVRHDYELLGGTTGGGAAVLNAVNVYFRNAATLGTSVVACSKVFLKCIAVDAHQGFMHGGTTWFASSPGGDTPNKLDFVAQRVVYDGGVTVRLSTARIRYLGPTFDIVSGSFVGA